PTIDTLRHVYVIAGGAAATRFARLCLYCDRESWANGFAKLAGDAALLAIRVAPQRMFSPETRAEGTLLVGIVDRHPRTKQISKGEPETGEQLGQQQASARTGEYSHSLTFPAPFMAATRKRRARRRSPRPKAARAAGTPSSRDASAGRS